MNRSKPFVEVEGIDGWLQCEILQKFSTASTGGRFFIENIHTLRPSTGYGVPSGLAKT